LLVGEPGSRRGHLCAVNRYPEHAGIVDVITDPHRLVVRSWIGGEDGGYDMTKIVETGIPLALALTEITLIHPIGLADRRDLGTDDGCTDRASQKRRICRNVTEVARGLSSSPPSRTR
jgi:hypothetical protein